MLITIQEETRVLQEDGSILVLEAGDKIRINEENSKVYSVPFAEISWGAKGSHRNVSAYVNEVMGEKNIAIKDNKGRTLFHFTIDADSI
jgi:hypothetical protein